MLNTTPTRFTDIVPREALAQPLAEDSYHRAQVRYVMLWGVVVLSIASALTVGALVYYYIDWVWAVFPISIGLLLLPLLLTIHESKVYTYKDYELRRQSYQGIIESVRVLIVQYNQVVVQKGGTLNLGSNSSALGESSAYSNEVPAINATYDLALGIIKVGIAAWSANGGKRPSPKPISAELITKQFHVGRELWQEAIQLIADSAIFDKPERSTWHPNYKDTGEAEKVLSKYMEGLGYFRSTSRGKSVWLK